MSETPPAGLNLAPWPQVDFSAFGSVETVPLSRIQNLVGGLLATCAELSERAGIKIAPLAFMVKAAVAALQAHPLFNASLDGTGRTWVRKKYFHIGIAVDTPGGLLVPVIRDADRKPVAEIATEISGTGLTPITNAPEPAIMGITRAVQKPVNVDGALQWRTMLPLSLSYDHRVINGADAARFCVTFANSLSGFSTRNSQV